VRGPFAGLRLWCPRPVVEGRLNGEPVRLGHFLKPESISGKF
jgi:hypothetical protein